MNFVVLSLGSNSADKIQKMKTCINDLKIVFGKPIKINSKDLEKENDRLRDVIVKMVGVK
jgi:7,8-dihydro-6-hydroxymethylpterin-pyrophosphokinase